MPRTRNGPVELEYQTFGDDRPEAVILINGLGSQMTRWPEDFCRKLVARGYRAIRFDNRDTGLSTWPMTDYTLADMAADAMAVLDAAGVAKAHVAGVSMGGMIAQRVALNHRDRTLSLTSIMSTTGAPGGFQTSPEAAKVLNVPPPNPETDYEAFVARGVANAKTIGSSAYPWDEKELRERVISEQRRGFNPAGVLRQRRAIEADGDRTEALKGLDLPTMVLHGADDPLLMPIGGELTAAAIPGAELRIIPGMGHDLPPGLHEIFIDAITAAASRAQPAVNTTNA